MSYKTYVNINRGTCLLHLQRYLILKSRVWSLPCFGLALRSHGLVLHIGLTSLRCVAFVKRFFQQIISQLFLLIFGLISRNHGLESRLWEWYNVPGPPYLPQNLLEAVVPRSLQRNFFKRVKLTEAIMAQMSTELLWKMSLMLLLQFQGRGFRDLPSK